MRMLFVRHGESHANVDQVFSNRGWIHPLTSQGRLQVEDLARRLVNQGVLAVFTSPLRRAVESAELISRATGAAYEVEPALIEYDVGVLEGATYAEGREQVDAVARRWAKGEWTACLPGGENCIQITSRFSEMVARILERFRPTPEATVVLVGHGGTFCHALPGVLDDVTPEFAMDQGMGYASIVEAHVMEASLRCTQWCGEPIPPREPEERA